MKQYKEFPAVNDIQLKNIQFFPSREWGPEGGFTFDVYYKNNKVGYVYNAGDGGEAEITLTGFKTKEEKKNFYNLVKKSIPESFWISLIAQYKAQKYPEFFIEQSIKEMSRTEGKDSDLINFLDFCEFTYKVEQSKKKSK